MRVIQIGRMKGRRLKGSVARLNHDLGRRQITSNEDVNVTLTVIVVNLEHDTFSHCEKVIYPSLHSFYHAFAGL